MDKEIQVIKKISEQDILKFIEISGDNNPIHTDKNFAKRTIFRKPIAHGLITASIISKGLTELMGEGNIWLSQELIFEKPVYVGDEITAILKIIEVNSQGVYKIETTIKNQKGIVVIRGFATSKVVRIKNKD